MDLRIGLSNFAEGADSNIAAATVRGEPAVVYRVLDDPGIAFSWTAEGCTYSVFLAPELTVEEVVAFAGKY